MTELIQQYVRLEVSQAAEEQDLGTFEQEDDFEESDQEELPFEQYEVSEYEMADDPDMPVTASPDDPVVDEESPSAAPAAPPAEAGNEGGNAESPP